MAKKEKDLDLLIEECKKALDRELVLGLQNDKQKKLIKKQKGELDDHAAKIRELEEDLRARQDAPLSRSLEHANRQKVKNKKELMEAQKSLKGLQE